MPFNKTKGQMGKWRSLGMKKILAIQKTVICLIKGSKRKYLLRSKLPESTSEMTYLKE